MPVHLTLQLTRRESLSVIKGGTCQCGQTVPNVEVDRIDAAILAEELAEIYSTSTPKKWPEQKKVNNWYLIDCVFYKKGFGYF